MSTWDSAILIGNRRTDRGTLHNMKNARPFILMDMIEMDRDEIPPSEHAYDSVLQLWIDLRTRTPLVSHLRENLASQFGETTLTATREGTDQTEIASTGLRALPGVLDACTAEAPSCGHKTQTQRPSQFGETTITRTSEGVDSTEVSSAEPMNINAAYSHF